MKKILAVAAVAVTALLAQNAAAEWDATIAATKVKESADKATAKVEEYKAKQAAKEAELKAKQDKQQADAEAKKAEQEKAIDEAKKSLGNLKDTLLK